MHDTTTTPRSHSRAAARVGGWSFIVAAIGFMAVFSYLAATFNYPTVLDGTAAEVLPRLLAFSDTGRAVWVVYALLPTRPCIPDVVTGRAACNRRDVSRAQRLSGQFHR